APPNPELEALALRLFKKFQPMLQRFVRNPAMQKDVLQEAFERLWEKEQRGDLREILAARAPPGQGERIDRIFYGSVINAAPALLKDERRGRTGQRRAAPETAVTAAPRGESSEAPHDPWRVGGDDLELRLAFLEFLATLSEDQQRAVDLCWME